MSDDGSYTRNGSRSRRRRHSRTLAVDNIERWQV